MRTVEAGEWGGAVHGAGRGLSAVLAHEGPRGARARPRVALLVLDRYAGHVAVLAMLGALLVSLVVWRVAWPGSYRGQVRPRLHRFWLLATYPRKWRRIASRVGLVVHDQTGSNRPWVYGG